MWDSDINVPADSLTVTCLFSHAIRADADRLSVYEGDRLLFTGQADSVTCIKRGMGVILKLSARGPAAALLDNEAEPVTYNRPSAVLMRRRHLAPFGLRLYESDNVPIRDKLCIQKGMSHWQVLKAFCRSRYQSEPRVSGDGTVYLRGLPEGDSVVFSDGGEGVAYFALQEAQRRHRLLSEVRLKFRQKNAYRSVVRNKNPEAVGISRVRFVNAAADNASVDTAEKMLENSNRDSYSLTLSCIGCRAELLGRSAVVRDSLLGSIGGLRVVKVKYIADSGGERSEVTLRKESFDVADELHNQ